jgi:hypothetical protein
MNLIDISELNKADVLAALYNNSRPQGMGFMHHNSSAMSAKEAAEILERGTYIDYLNGRVMKVDLSGEELDPYLYDRDNGHGAAARALKPLFEPFS